MIAIAGGHQFGVGEHVKTFLTNSAGNSIFSKTLFEFKLCSFCWKWLSCSNSNQASSTLKILERKNYLNHILRLVENKIFWQSFKFYWRHLSFFEKKIVSPDMLLVTGAEPKQAGRLSEFYFLKCIFIVLPRGKQHIKNKNELDVVSVQEHFEAQLWTFREQFSAKTCQKIRFLSSGWSKGG